MVNLLKQSKWKTAKAGTYEIMGGSVVHIEGL